ncbi:hypothetical protein MAIT1_00503 [Magnetofaba australis IT-1]|uniref:Uncharacterized protein n=1 Tax=Magnetofaba australis IT-1 TaxID=1434232 RepID=A0A1Y2JYV8_9PROT|nr:hypothetical protein MAIT1_00503 [Magnetofaba australis IT-1]
MDQAIELGVIYRRGAGVATEDNGRRQLQGRPQRAHAAPDQPRGAGQRNAFVYQGLRPIALYLHLPLPTTQYCASKPSPQHFPTQNCTVKTLSTRREKRTHAPLQPDRSS